MEKKIQRTLSLDTALIAVFIILIWGIMLFSLNEIYSLSIEMAVFSVVTAACSLCLIFLTIALLGVISHLKKNKAYLYAQEFSQIAKYQNIDNCRKVEVEYEEQ